MFLVTAILPAIEPLADTVVLEFVDDVIESHEGYVDDVHLPIGIRRHGTEHEHSKTTEASPQSTRSAPRCR